MKQLLLFSIIFFNAISMYAQWSGDPDYPLAVCDAAGNQGAPVILSDGSDGYYIFWIDSRSGAAESIYGQHLDGDGIPLWDSNGKEIINQSGKVIGKMDAVLNNGNKILLGWTHGATNPSDTLYVQKFNNSGDPIWNSDVKVAGNNLSGGGGYWGIVNFTMMAKDDGCYFAYIPSGYGYTYIAINRVDGSGDVLWGYNGKYIEGLNVGYPSLIPDGEGGAYVTWLNGNFFAQRFNEDSTLVWPAKKNITGCTSGTGGTYANLTYFLTVPDDEKGFVAAWTSANDDVYVSRVDLNGNYVWSDTCTAICNETHSQEQVTLVKQDNDYYVGWVDSRDNGGIYMQKVNEDGSPEWTPNGIQVSNQSLYIPAIKSAVSDSGRVVIFYQAGAAFYAQKVNSDSTLFWEEPLQLLANSNNPFYQLYELVPGENGNIIGAAETGSNSGNQNIAAFSLDAYINTGVNEISSYEKLITVFPNPASSYFKVNFPKAFNAQSLIISDISGRVLDIFDIKNQTSTTVDASTYPEGAYYMKVAGRAGAATKKMIVVSSE